MWIWACQNDNFAPKSAYINFVTLLGRYRGSLRKLIETNKIALHSNLYLFSLFSRERTVQQMVAVLVWMMVIYGLKL